MEFKHISVAVVAAVLTGCGQLPADREALSEAAPVVTVTEKVTVTPKAKAKPKPKAVIEEGTWVVGLDIPAGTYRSLEAVSSRCYWSITRTGSNGADIIQNDIPGGGRPMVTLKKGHDFTTRRCGEWGKAK